MSDLSRLLGDVYGTSGEETPRAGAPAETPGDPAIEAGEDHRPDGGGGLPEWADEAVLDEAFSKWVPGPPAEAPLAERSMLTDLAAQAAAEPRPEPVPAPEPAFGAPEPEPEPAADDSDLLAPRSGWLFDQDEAAPTQSLDALPTDGVMAAVDHSRNDAVLLSHAGGEGAVAVAEAPAARWQRDHDDLLPERHRTSRRRH